MRFRTNAMGELEQVSENGKIHADIEVEESLRLDQLNSPEKLKAKRYMQRRAILREKMRIENYQRMKLAEKKQQERIAMAKAEAQHQAKLIDARIRAQKDMNFMAIKMAQQMDPQVLNGSPTSEWQNAVEWGDSEFIQPNQQWMSRLIPLEEYYTTAIDAISSDVNKCRVSKEIWQENLVDQSLTDAIRNEKILTEKVEYEKAKEEQIAIIPQKEAQELALVKATANQDQEKTKVAMVEVKEEKKKPNKALWVAAGIAALVLLRR